MDVVTAAQQLVPFIERAVSTKLIPQGGTDAGWEHLNYMINEIEKHNMSEGKSNRWLGYIQGVLVASGAASLGEMKNVNRMNARFPEDT